MAIYKRKSGRWAVAIDVERDVDGKRRRLRLGTFQTRKEAERAEREALTAKDRGVAISPTTVTVEEIVARYISIPGKRPRGEKTLEEYQRIADLYILPHLGSIPVAKLRPAKVNEWKNALIESGGRNGAALSGKTARHAFTLLNAALRRAVREELAGRNVCESADAPEVRRKELKALDESEISRLLAIARGTRWEHFVAIALGSGARRGEILALSWHGIDLDARTMRINGSMSQIAKRVFLKGTKTDRARVVPLSRTMVAALKSQRALQAADRLAIGSAYVVEPSAPVFTSEIGERLTPKSATNAFARLAKLAKVSTTSLHALRHTAASFIIGSGIDARTAATILGHANPSVTLNTYSHTLKGAEAAAIDVLAERLERAVAIPR